MRTNLQFFGGRGASFKSGDVRGLNSRGDYKSKTIWETYHSNYNIEKSQRSAETMVKMMDALQKEYGNLNDAVEILEYAQIGGFGAGVGGFYNSETRKISLNNAFLNEDKARKIYDANVKSGHNVSRGKKTTQEAIMSHEVGHAIAFDIARKNNINANDYVQAVVTTAQRNLGIRANDRNTAVRQISSYAGTNYHETIAEAVADVYCNGRKANRLSKAIVRVLKRDMK